MNIRDWDQGRDKWEGSGEGQVGSRQGYFGSGRDTQNIN